MWLLSTRGNEHGQVVTEEYSRGEMQRIEGQWIADVVVEGDYSRSAAVSASARTNLRSAEESR